MAPAAFPLWFEIAVSVLLVAGGAFALLGAIGLTRLRDFYMRLHAPTKASTLGVGGALLASMLYFGWTGQRVVIHELLITLFVFMTAPIAAHLMVKAALEREPQRRPPSPGARTDTAGTPPDARPDGPAR
jgi:multicomponent K+:H+ antiporter subunit G